MKKIGSIQAIQKQEIEEQPKSIFKKKDVPKVMFNTRKLKGLENKLQSIKICNYQYEFLHEIQKVLDLYSQDELHYNTEFVLFVMNEVERFLLKPKSGESKKQLVIEACKSYFNDDADLVVMVINLVFKKLKQVKFIKRQGLKLLRFFLKIKQSQH